ncbi:M20 family metallopeptidase [Bacteroidota bacterium]
MNIIESVEAIHEELIKHRRHIHSNPELSFKEFKTSEYIKSVLSDLEIENKIIAETGVVGLIGSGDKCVALRADMDALPIQEETGLSYSSGKDGIMHACGHDMHVAMLLGAAKILKENESELDGTVKLIFQPGEEKLPGGAKILIEEGVLDNPTPQAVFGQHIYPEAPTGTISIAPGFIMAAPDELYWTIHGKGGHAAQPHHNNDAILAASNLVVFLKSMLTKYKNPVSHGILSVTAIHGGNATNVFPDEVKLMGTFRSFDENWRVFMHEEIRKRSQEICHLYNTECTVEILKGYPPVFNTPEKVDFIRDIAAGLLGTESVLNFEPKMWGEDFAYYAQKVPAAFWFLGVRQRDKNHIPALHNAKLAPDEEALIYGTVLFVETAMRLFK